MFQGCLTVNVNGKSEIIQTPQRARERGRDRQRDRVWGIVDGYVFKSILPPSSGGLTAWLMTA